MAVQKSKMMPIVTDDYGLPVMPGSFDVVVQRSIGTVTVDEYGDGPSWREAAYTLIVRNSDEGTYSFPVPGGTETVVVTRSMVGDSE